MRDMCQDSSQCVWWSSYQKLTSHTKHHTLNQGVCRMRVCCRHVRVRSGFLVNRLLSQAEKWESVFTIYRDLQPLFDHINLSTALHRLAKTSFRHRVGLLCKRLAFACIQKTTTQHNVGRQLQAWPERPLGTGCVLLTRGSD